MGTAAVVVSLARSGSLAVTPAGRWRASHDRLRGNPVGAGDALVAGLAMASVAGSLSEKIRVRKLGGRQT